MKTEHYTVQCNHWPKRGRHILGQFSDGTIIVYQAYSPAIGHFAAQHQYFGGDFSFSRMSWIKPNFLWMMYRSGWGTKVHQEVTLAISLKRSAFDLILQQAVHSTFFPEIYPSHAAWKRALSQSPIRLQWDPDHDPFGNKLERRAIQLGLAGDVLKSFSQDWIIKIEDISYFVTEQRAHVSKASLDHLMTPQESVYPVTDEEVALHLGINL